jgi:hypothetical protein
MHELTFCACRSSSSGHDRDKTEGEGKASLGKNNSQPGESACANCQFGESSHRFYSTSEATSRQGRQERKMSSMPVQRDQFEVSPQGITHKPTGATYTPHPGAPYCGIMNPSQLGNVLTSGNHYRLQEVQTMMEQLWAKYVEANPRLFEVHD